MNYGEGEPREAVLVGEARNAPSRSKSATICKRRRHESHGLVNILYRGTNDYLQAGWPTARPITDV